MPKNIQGLASHHAEQALIFCLNKKRAGNVISSNVVATQQRKNDFFSAFAAPKFGTLLTYSYLCSQTQTHGVEREQTGAAGQDVNLQLQIG